MAPVPAHRIPEWDIVVPTLNEERVIAACLHRLVQLAACRIIVVDGGSTDATCAIAQEWAAQHTRIRVIHAPRGRGSQLRAGAEQCRAPYILFLHADSAPPADTDALLAAFIQSGRKAATFRLRFDTRGWVYRMCEWAAAIDTPLTRFGDQGLFIESAFYRACGGFPPQPILEDLLLFRVIKKQTRLHYLQGTIITSARRFRRNGPLRQLWLDIQLVSRFLLGAGPAEIAARYEKTATRATDSTIRDKP